MDARLLQTTLFAWLLLPSTHKILQISICYCLGFRTLRRDEKGKSDQKSIKNR